MQTNNSTSILSAIKKYRLELIAGITVAFILGLIQIYLKRPMLLAERFCIGAGWIQVVFASGYAAFVTNKMKEPTRSAAWRIRIWLIFSSVFFAQLILGLLGYSQFLMTGKLHFPIPALIIAGPLYRMELSFMLILLTSTILISGPAWCGQLCYFGAFDAMASKGRRTNTAIKHVWKYKIFILSFVFASAVLLRIVGATAMQATLAVSLLGLISVVTISVYSLKQKKMVHCVAFCPIGTVVSIGKYASPFRMSINEDCSQCMRCTVSCRYSALTPIDIRNLKPGLTCTYCGDCISSCHSSSIRYRFFGYPANSARYVYLLTTIVLHSVFLMLARI